MKRIILKNNKERVVVSQLMRFAITLLFVFFALGGVNAQDGNKVFGKIYDTKSKQPLSYAEVSLNHNHTITDDEGYFELKNVSNGKYKLSVNLLGYKAYVRSIEVNNEEVEINIPLDLSTQTVSEVIIHENLLEHFHEEDIIVSKEINTKFLAENRENSLMQTLKKVPGLNAMSIGSGQSKPMIRGLGFNRISVVQNGVKHGGQEWGRDHGLEIDQYNINEIKIIKGAGSLLYGSDAIGGVIDIQPNKIQAANSFSGNVNLLAETNNNLFGVSAGVQTRKQKWFYGARLTYRDYADYKVPTDQINYDSYIFYLDKNNLRNTAGREANGAFNFGIITEKFKNETSISNVNSKGGFFANAHGLEVRTSQIDYDSSNRDIDLPYYSVNHFKVLNNTTINKLKHNIHINLGYQNNYRQEFSEPSAHGYMPKPDNSQERLFNKNIITANVDDHIKFDKHELTIGLSNEFQQNKIGGWGFLIPEYERYTVGAFAYDKFKLTKDLYFLAGLRYDYGILHTEEYLDWFPSLTINDLGEEEEVNIQRSQDKTYQFHNYSGSIGIGISKKKMEYKVNLSKSFRMPLANELASDGVNYHMFRFEKGNSELKAEQAFQLDAEISHEQERFNFILSPFATYFTNYIYLNPTSNFYESLQVFEYTQRKVFRTGGELSASVEIFKNFNFTNSFEYVFSRQLNGDKKGFTIPFSPPLSNVFSLDYTISTEGVFKNPKFILDYRITAKQNDIVPPEEYTDGYHLVNFSFLVGLDVFKKNLPLELRIKLNNLLNTKYYDHTSYYRLVDVPEAGINFSTSITINF